MRTASGSRSGLIVGLYVALGTTLIISLRAMSRRWREDDQAPDDVPYGPESGRLGRRGRRHERGRRRRRRPLVVATMYAVFGGADFGAGVWSLLAGGGDRGRRPRALIDWAIGPVWEANHVWLIFTLVVLWSGFPTAFEAIFSTLFIPLSLAALGIVLRGSGFAFQHTARRARGRALAERFFGLASLLTPFFMGTVVGAIAGERVPVGNEAGDLVTSGSTRCRWCSARSSSRRARTCPRCSSSARPGVPRRPTSSGTSSTARWPPPSQPALSQSPGSSCCTGTAGSSSTASRAMRSRS